MIWEEIGYNEKNVSEVVPMEPRGFIHSMMDVKVLILYVMARVLYPVGAQTIYELCYQDDGLSYFDVQEALPQMVQSGHLEQQEDGTYLLTDKGRETCELVEDSLAYPVAKRAERAVERFNRDVRRDSLIRTEVLPRGGGDFSAVMGLDDEMGNLMTLELMAPTREQARRLTRVFHDHAEEIYQTVMNALLEQAEPQPANDSPEDPE